MTHRLFTIAAAIMTWSSAAVAQNGSPRQPVEQSVEIRSGFVVLVRMPAPVYGVLVGNPALADVVPRSDRIIAISGKASGVTNVMTLDDRGEPVANVTVTISGHEPAKVYAHSKSRVNEYWSYQCAPVCVRLGDPLEGAPPLPELPRGSVVTITSSASAPAR